MSSREIEIDDDPRFTRREARVERIGYAVMAVLLLAAALGLFANGPLSHRTAVSGDVELHHQRFARNQGRTTLEIRTAAGAAKDGEVVVSLPQRFLEAYEIERVFPEPASVRVEGDAVHYSFEVGDETSLRASLHLRPGRIGRQRGEVAVGGDAVRFTQLVYP